ncbi:tyrosine aminotransferase [Actinoplanes sichuanensis]|uniref:Aminotransferase class I/II-fold pyridoxal phosphate-dependent enzyme n=1 Tax=Actinoplanes sichuanensis TaxID=512349 RepID=A0ABW4ATX6_9ACTN|nr:aminotransferase class I/II-fold pyridoxal phosphate-dependent enzyme [Actinoplanes sichuanensis]BEL07076.1 tyrosine aminotransferase [Actinoplanes sichuanensis]
MLSTTAPDPLWQLTADCAADPRPDRLDLLVGVYRDDSGAAPVPAAVHAAELRLADRARSKEYVGPSGNIRFRHEMTRLLLADPALEARADGLQTVAGTGALRLLAELLAATGPDRTVLLGTPAYVNHPAILAAARLRTTRYPVTADGAAMLAAVDAAQPGDVLLLQGCCHNPTGLGMSLALWDELAAALSRRGVVPFIDQAYFGLGDGLDEDLAGMRRLLRVVPEAVVAVSASKAWGLYSERTGCALVLSADAGRRQRARTMLETIARISYSQPPAHGAAIVEEILTDPILSVSWRDELEGMRRRLGRLRDGLATGTGFAGLGNQRGMFLTLPLDAAAMLRLRQIHGVYGLPSGRINLAGIPSSRIEAVASAIRSVGVRNHEMSA